MRLVIFDCDGTLVDSQHVITAAMEHAFRALDLVPPSRLDVLGVVGLSLPQAFAVLAAAHPLSRQVRLAELYRDHFPLVRQAAQASEPLYCGMREVVAALRRGGNILGIATGKSKRGVARLLEREGWQADCHTIQTADDHPSKPHPSMILQAMVEAGVRPEATVMVGDTSYDMEMALSARVGAVGVAWGYHAADRLAASGAHAIVRDGADLLAAIEAQFENRQAVT
jgi:phosphoglycolate phosphatase